MIHWWYKSCGSGGQGYQRSSPEHKEFLSNILRACCDGNSLGETSANWPFQLNHIGQVDSYVGTWSKPKCTILSKGKDHFLVASLRERSNLVKVLMIARSLTNVQKELPCYKIRLIPTLSQIRISSPAFWFSEGKNQRYISRVSLWCFVGVSTRRKIPKCRC